MLVILLEYVTGKQDDTSRKHIELNNSHRQKEIAVGCYLSLMTDYLFLIVMIQFAEKGNGHIRPKR